MIKISVIIPIYNVEEYLDKCITSVFNQNLQKYEFEIILVDDESPDHSIDIAKNKADEHNNIKVISQKNKGLGGARNTGIQNATGTYLLFLDADDYLLPNSLKDVMEIAQSKQLDVLEFGCQGVFPNGKIAYEVSKTTNGIIYSGISYYNHLKYMNSACNKLYKRELLKANNILFLENIYIEDFEFNTRVFYHTNKVMAIQNIVAHYLQSPNSITRNTSEGKKEKMLNDIMIVLKQTKGFSEDKLENNSSKDLNTYFGTRLSFLNITIFYHLYKNKRDYNKIVQLKHQLEREELLHLNYPVSERFKDIFRIVMLHNFWFFKITQPIQRILFNFSLKVNPK